MKKIFYFAMALACSALAPVAGPVMTAAAQTPTPAPGKAHQVRVKMIRTENGKTQVVDTTITVDEAGTHPDLLRKLRRADLLPGKAERIRLPLPDLPDSLARHLPALVRLPHLRPPGQVDSMKVIYFNKDRPGGDTILIKDMRAFELRGPAGLLADSLLELNHLLLPAMSLDVVALDSLLRNMKLPEQLDLDLKELPLILESEAVIRGKAGKKGDVLEPALSERKVVVIRKAKDDSKKVQPTSKPVKARKEALPGLRENLKFRTLRYYPNPSKGRFTISLEPVKTGNLTLQVLDPGGQVIYEESFQNPKGPLHKEIDISGSRSGIYFLRIVQGNSYLTKKLVIK